MNSDDRYRPFWPMPRPTRLSPASRVMGWYLDLRVARNTPVSPEASEVIRLLANGVMPPVNSTVLSATMELIEEDILLHTEAKTREELFKTLAKTLPDE